MKVYELIEELSKFDPEAEATYWDWEAQEPTRAGLVIRGDDGKVVIE